MRRVGIWIALGGTRAGSYVQGRLYPGQGEALEFLDQGILTMLIITM